MPFILRISMFFLVLFFLQKVSGQLKSDSLYYKLQDQINVLESKYDSLKVNQSVSDSGSFKKSDFYALLSSINGETGQIFADENRRSKRRGLDELFEETLSKQKGLNLSGQMMGVLFWDGKKNGVNTVVGTLDIFAASSFGKNNLVFINLQSQGGNGPSDTLVNIHGYHAGAGSTKTIGGLNALNVLEAWTEFKIKKLTATIGKLDLTNYFDPNSVANDEYTQFVSGGFVNSISFPVPANAPAMVLSSRFLKTLTFKLGISSISNEVDNLFNDLFLVAQVSRDFLNDVDDQIASISTYGYHNTAFLSSFGFGLSGDLKLTKKLYGFGRFGVNNNEFELSYNVKQSWSLGLQTRDLFKIEEHSISASIGYARHVLYDLEINENAIEAYLKYGFSNKIFCSPILQYYYNANGEVDSDQFLFGLRSRVTF